VRQKRLRSGTHDIDAGEVTDEEAIERETKNLNLLATLGYGFDQHWSVLLRVPAVRRDHSHDLLDEETGEASTEERWRFTRLGDAQLLARYQAAIGEGATSLAAFGGLKLPTGSIHVANDDTLLDGRRFSVRGKVLLVKLLGHVVRAVPGRDAGARGLTNLAHRAEGVELLAISVDELADEPKVREVARAFRFPVAMAKSSRLSGFKAIWRMPVSSVLDRDGRLVKDDWFMGTKVDAATLDAVIRPLL
jgi:hypothetical protein